MFVESEAGFTPNIPPSYFLPWSVSGGGGRIAGKALQIEQGNVKKLIANKIDLTLFSSGKAPKQSGKGLERPAIGRVSDTEGFPSRLMQN